ncbi:MAG: T9SS type A sorting domain-containing protein, partial [Ignavibacteriota bacterium]
VNCPDSGVIADHYSVDFGTLSLCADVFDTIIVSNLGCADATLSSSISDPTLGISLAKPGKPTLAVQARDTLVIHLHPNKKGLASADLLIKTSGGDISVPITWIGDQSAASLSIIPPNIDLGNISRCSEIFDTIHLQNLGCDSLVIADSLSDPTLGFTISHRPNSILASGAGDIVIVHFLPKNIGSISTSLHLHHGNRDTIITIVGNVSPGEQLVEFDPPTLDFGQLTNCQTVFDTIYFKSTGCDTLALTAVIDDKTSGASIIKGPRSAIPQGETDTVIISLRPHRRGLIDLKLFLSYQGKDSSIDIRAFGVNDSTPIVLGFNPLIQAYQCGDQPFQITFGNPTCDSLTLISYLVSGKDSSDFFFSTVTPLGIAAGTVSKISSDFDPQSPGAKNIFVTFHLLRSDSSSFDTTISILGLGVLENIRVTLQPSIASVRTLGVVSIPITALDPSSLPVSVFDFSLKMHTDLLDPSIDGSAGLFAGAAIDRFTIYRDSISVRLRLPSPKAIVPGVLCAINARAYVADTLSTVIALQRSSIGTLTSQIECLAITNTDSLIFKLDEQCGDLTTSHYLAGKFPSLQSITPNPGSGIERISYSLPVSSTTKIEVFNALGQRVRSSLFENESAGNHDHEINISDFPSGSYIFRITMGGRSEARAVELLK